MVQSTSSPQPRSRRGFTLIELLVVVAILGILAAILFPVFATARDKARMSVCANNLHQIGLAVHMYVEDNNNYYPRKPFFLLKECSWADELEPYVKSPDTFQCPSYEYGEYRTGCPPPDSTYDYTYQGSYDMNSLNGGHSRVHEALFTHPASTILALDGAGGGFIDPGFAPITGPTDLTTRGVVVRHNEGDNILFVDGHVKWLKLDSMAKQSLWSASGTE